MADMGKMDQPIAADIPVTRSHMQLSYRMLRYHLEAQGGDAALIEAVDDCRKTNKIDQIITDYDRNADTHRATTRKGKTKALSPTERDVRFLLRQLSTIDHAQDRDSINELAARYGFEFPLFTDDAKPKRK
jgi:hypothetical protein